MLSLDQAVSGEVSGAFTDYGSVSNRRLVETAYRGVGFLSQTPANELDAVARHPETTRCHRNEDARPGTSQ